MCIQLIIDEQNQKVLTPCLNAFLVINDYESSIYEVLEIKKGQDLLHRLFKGGRRDYYGTILIDFEVLSYL